MSTQPVVVIFSEDSGKQADSTLRVLVKKLFVRVEPSTMTQLLDFKSPEGAARAAWHGHSWKDSKNDTPRRALVRDLARRLATGDFVVLHYDGDAPWTGACSPGSPNDAPVDGLIKDVCNRMEVAELPTLLYLVPHYSIESWLYLNRAAVEELVRDGKVSPDALAWLDDNTREGGYDHIPKVKKQCPLNDGWNQVLAERQWPARRAAMKSKSWAAAEARWRECQALVEALAGTAM